MNYLEYLFSKTPVSAMIKVLIFCLAFTYGYCRQPSKFFNVSSDFSPKIIQGEDANEGQFPYMVSLNWKGNGHACGASILTSNWVLTAAHCCLTGSDMILYSGSIYLSQGGQNHDIVQYVVHGDYDPNNHWRNDICAVKIADNFQFSDRVQQVTLPSQDWAVNDGDLLTISGWGYTSPIEGQQVIPDRLQVGYNFVALSEQRCRDETHVDVFSGHLCAHASHSGQGVCNGDSGSPLMKDGVQVGIASWVFLPCGSGAPDVYTRVPSYITWIQQVIGADAKNLKFAK